MFKSFSNEPNFSNELENAVLSTQGDAIIVLRRVMLLEIVLFRRSVASVDQKPEISMPLIA